MPNLKELAINLAEKAVWAGDSQDAMRFSQAATNVTNAAATIAMLERDKPQPPIDIDAAVNRFLAWRFPPDFKPDGGIEYSAVVSLGTPYEAMRALPTGTNLLTAAQAEAMIRHILDL